jgi:hypothetical protein
MQINSKKLEIENASIEDIYEALSDNKTLVLFNTIALADAEGAEIQIRRMGLTTRMYYVRISKLTEVGLIRRLNGRYFLTLLGKMIYDIHVTTSRVLNYHWKFKAIESIQLSCPAGMKLPEEEFSKIVDTLIDDHKIKNMVAKALTLPLTNTERYPRQQIQNEEESQIIKVQSRTIRSLR